MSKTSTKSPEFPVKMIWSFKRLFIICGTLTVIILMLPNLYFINEQSVSYRHLVLNEINKFGNVFESSSNKTKTESGVKAPVPPEKSPDPPKPLPKPTIKTTIKPKIIEKIEKVQEKPQIIKVLKKPIIVTGKSVQIKEIAKKSPPKLDVILLAYHRTGSSLTGEILSLIPNSAYFFEPLFYVNVIQRKTAPDLQVSFLNKLFDCDDVTLNEIYSKSSVHVIRKLFGEAIKKNDADIQAHLESNCKNSEVKIAKTIRLRIDDYVASTIFRKIKIIHLVRDPRAMLSSVNQATIWREEDRTPERACESLTREVADGDSMPHNIYLRIRYEDLVVNPKETSQRMFNFLGVKVDDEILDEYISTHMKAENNPVMTKYTGSYFSTIRNSSFNFNHWKEEVTQEFILTVETYCEWVMERLGYEILS